jgi:hypothetical protein
MEQFHRGEKPSLEGRDARMSDRETKLFQAKLAKIGLGFLLT